MTHFRFYERNYKTRPMLTCRHLPKESWASLQCRVNKHNSNQEINLQKTTICTKNRRNLKPFVPRLPSARSSIPNGMAKFNIYYEQSRMMLGKIREKINFKFPKTAKVERMNEYISFTIENELESPSTA